jgi:hypothetical protein
VYAFRVAELGESPCRRKAQRSGGIKKVKSNEVGIVCCGKVRPGAHRAAGGCVVRVLRVLRVVRVVWCGVRDVRDVVCVTCVICVEEALVTEKSAQKPERRVSVHWLVRRFAKREVWVWQGAGGGDEA